MILALGVECNGDTFEGGITNGAAWKPVSGKYRSFLILHCIFKVIQMPYCINCLQMCDKHVGSMADYQYRYTNCFEIALEVSCCKYPDSSELGSLWQENKDAMLIFIEQVEYPY